MVPHLESFSIYLLSRSEEAAVMLYAEEKDSWKGLLK